MPSLGDRAAFERCVRAHGDEASGITGTMPRALHVRLRDSLGNHIRVELFCVTVQSLVQRRFFVGIREFSDHTPLPECCGAGHQDLHRVTPGAGVSGSQRVGATSWCQAVCGGFFRQMLEDRLTNIPGRHR